MQYYNIPEIQSVGDKEKKDTVHSQIRNKYVDIKYRSKKVFVLVLMNTKDNIKEEEVIYYCNFVSS